jgi:probable HAF family extracellular repeat protein
VFRAFLWQEGTFTELPLLPQGAASSFAWGINATGQVVGAASTATNELHAVLWDQGAVIDLGTLPGGHSSFARGINDRGQVVGYSSVANGETHAFLWENGTMIDLGTLPGGTFSVAEAINPG